MFVCFFVFFLFSFDGGGKEGRRGKEKRLIIAIISWMNQDCGLCKTW